MKKLLAVAVATAFAAPAMADTTLYGKIHTSIHMTDAGSSSTGTQTNVSSNSSRIGVKGKEKISDSLDVIYGVEWGYNAVENGGGLGDRNRYLGLKGGWGALMLGRLDTPEKSVGRKAELFGDTLGDARSITSRGVADGREDNSIVYTSPKMGGFSYKIASINADDGVTQGYSVNGMYKAGGLTAGIGHTDLDNDGSTTRIAGNYNYGKGKVAALVQQDEDLGGTAGVDRDVWGLGATMKTASGSIGVQTYVAGDAGNTANSGATLTTVGYNHKLSKRTKLYALYTQMKNEQNAGYRLGGGVGDSVTPAATGEDPSGIALGMVHKF